MTYHGYYPEDEVPYCCKCQADDAPYYSNWLRLYEYKGSYYCEDCLFEETYTFEAGVNYILAYNAVADFDELFYKGCFYDILRWDWNEKDAFEVKDYCREYFTDYVDWIEQDPSMTSLATLHNTLMTGGHDE